MLEVALSRKEDICSAGGKEEEVYFAGEREQDALKERENTEEEGRVHVRGRAQIPVQVTNSLAVRVFNPYPKKSECRNW